MSFYKYISLCLWSYWKSFKMTSLWKCWRQLQYFYIFISSCWKLILVTASEKWKTDEWQINQNETENWNSMHRAEHCDCDSHLDTEEKNDFSENMLCFMLVFIPVKGWYLVWGFNFYVFLRIFFININIIINIDQTPYLDKAAAVVAGAVWVLPSLTSVCGDWVIISVSVMLQWCIYMMTWGLSVVMRTSCQFCQSS